MRIQTVNTSLSLGFHSTVCTYGKQILIELLDEQTSSLYKTFITWYLYGKFALWSSSVGKKDFGTALKCTKVHQLCLL